MNQCRIGTNFREISAKISYLSFKKLHCEIPSDHGGNFVQISMKHSPKGIRPISMFTTSALQSRNRGFIQSAYDKCYFSCVPLQWPHNERHCVSNHWRLYYLLNRLFRCRSKKISKLSVTGLFEENPPVTGGFPEQRASNAENVSISLRNHGNPINHARPESLGNSATHYCSKCTNHSVMTHPSKDSKYRVTTNRATIKSRPYWPFTGKPPVDSQQRGLVTRKGFHVVTSLHYYLMGIVSLRRLAHFKIWLLFSIS